MSVADLSLPHALIHLGQMLSTMDTRFMSTEQKATARDEIDLGLQAMATKLKSYRNTLSAISCLPDEIIAEIFRQTMLDDQWSNNWTRLLLVCSHWRTLAITTPRLWNYISEERLTASELLGWERRSKAAPLTLVLKEAQCHDIFRRNMDRLVVLQVNGSRNQLSGFFDDVEALPNLHTLEIVAWEYADLPASEHMQYLYYQNIRWPFPSFVVTGGAPSLRHLTLHSIVFQSRSDFRLLANLTHLDLKAPHGFGHDDPPYLPSIEDLHAVVTQSPLLRYLAVHRYLEEPTPDSGPGAPPLSSVTLPFLEVLDLEMIIQDTVTLLASMQFPPTTLIALSVYHGDHTDDPPPSSYSQQLRALMVILRHHTLRNGPLGHPLRAAKLVCREYSVSIAFFHAEAALYQKKRPVVELQLPAWTQHEIQTVLTQVANYLPLNELQYLDACGIRENLVQRDDNALAPLITTRTWTTFLRLLPDNLSISIGLNEALPVLLEAVQNTMQTADIASARTFMQKRRRKLRGLGGCPVAKLIVREDLELYLGEPRFRSWVGHMGYTPLEQTVYDGLHNWLAAYAAMKTPFKPAGKVLPALEIRSLKHDSRIPAQRADVVAGLRSLVGELKMEEHKK